MSGIWTIVPRFACHLPMGLVAFSGKRIYDAVGGLADTGIYDAIPHGQTFLSGLKMYTNWVRNPSPLPNHCRHEHLTGHRDSSPLCGTL